MKLVIYVETIGVEPKQFRCEIEIPFAPWDGLELQFTDSDGEAYAFEISMLHYDVMDMKFYAYVSQDWETASKEEADAMERGLIADGWERTG